MEKRQFLMERGLQLLLCCAAMGCAVWGDNGAQALWLVAAMLATLPIFGVLHHTGRWYKPKWTRGFINKAIGLCVALSIPAVGYWISPTGSLAPLRYVYPLVVFALVIAWEYHYNFGSNRTGE